MIINPENMDALKVSYMTSFQAGLDRKPAEDLSFAFTLFPSTTASNMYAWLDRVPGFREWVGERIYQDISTKKFEIVNREFETSLKVKRNEIEDDQYGVFAPLVEGIPHEWNELKLDTIMDVLTTNATCFDGLAFFSDSHVYGESNTIDNLTTSALSTSTFEAAFTAAAEYKFSDNRPCKTRYTHLIVGEKNRGTAIAILADTHLSGSIALPNPNAGRVELHISPQLAGAYDDYWFLLDCSGVIKPVAFQLRKDLSLEVYNNTEAVKESGYMKVLGDGRMAAGPTLPHLAYAGIL